MASRLPYPYQEVEYIESNGTQYIDTGVAATNIGKLEIDAQFTRTNAFQINGSFAGGFNEGALDIGIYENKFFMRNGGANSMTVSADTNRHSFAIDTAESKGYIDSNSYNLAKTALTSATMYLFARHRSVTEAYCYEKLYSSAIYNTSGNLSRHLIPCYDVTDITKHTAGLYDLVNNQFYGNSGTGYFIVGEDVYNGGRITNMRTLKSIAGIKNASGSPLVKMTNLNTGKYIEFGQEPVEAENEI